jgi:hypothetical protein
MPTADDYRREIEDNYRAYAAELEQSGSAWDHSPGGSAEGEAAWSPRQVAEHVAGACTFFGAGIGLAIGIDGPARQQFQFASAGDAVEATAAAHRSVMDVLAQLSDEHLPIEVDAARLGRLPLERIVGILSHHYVDHAHQLRSLRGG